MTTEPGTSKPGAWILTIGRDKAAGPLAEIYAAMKAGAGSRPAVYDPPTGEVANIVLCHSLDPEGLRPHIANWDEVAEMLIQRVHREAVGGTADVDTRDLLDEALARPGVPEAWRSPDFVPAPTPVLPIVFAKDGLTLSYFTMVTSLGTPLDITAQELRIESFYPADDASERHRWT